MLHDEIQITGWNNDFSVGSRDAFGIRSTNIPSYQWTNCRESTATYSFGYYQQCGWQLIPYSMNYTSFGAGNYRNAFCNIARMFDVVERQMGWWDRTRVHPTQWSHVCGIHVSGGWFQNFNAFSLATLLIRAGNRFSENQSLNGVLALDVYARNTLPAIQRFLAGHQHYTGNANGWCQAFEGRQESEIRSLLIRKSMVENLAHALWENAGSPPGTSFWLEACRRLSPHAVQAA